MIVKSEPGIINERRTLSQFLNYKYAFMKHLITGAILIAATIAIAFYPSPIYAGTGKAEKTKTITVDDAKIVYRVYGAKGGTPLVLLSPLGSSLDDWDPAIIDGLTKFSTVVVFDNKGVGSSSGKTPTTIAEMAHDAISFIKAAGYSKVEDRKSVV